MRFSWLRHCAVAVVSACALSGLYPAAAFGQANAAVDYAGESIVLVHNNIVYTMAADGTGVEECELVVRVQSEAAVRALGVVSIAYASESLSALVILAP